MSEGLSQPVILDATVLSNFAASDSLRELYRTFERLVVVSTVRGELYRGLEHGHDFLGGAVASLSALDAVTVIEASEIPEYPELRDRLDPGEADSLIVAIERDGSLATDDAAARRGARKRDVPVTGSVGILARLVVKEDVDVETADRWLDTWVERRNYYSPIGSVRELLPDDE